MRKPCPNNPRKLESYHPENRTIKEINTDGESIKEGLNSHSSMNLDYEIEIDLNDIEMNNSKSNRNKLGQKINSSKNNSKIPFNSEYFLLKKKKLNKQIINNIVVDTNHKVCKAIEILNSKFQKRELNESECSKFNWRKLNNKKESFFNLIKSAFSDLKK